jgi:hypothetical protein
MLGFVSLGARATRVPNPGVLGRLALGLDLLVGLFTKTSACTTNALAPHFLLAPMGRLGVDALLRRGRSEEPYQA